jgi:aryl-alcohol dehydrogenase-like predicted oxidoreductase
MTISEYYSQNNKTLGLGLAALGRPGYINLGHEEDFAQGKSVQDLKDRTMAVLDFAWEQGIRHFDTARSYGRGEEFLGEWLRSRSIPQAGVFISSKWGYTYTADWQVQAEAHEIKEHSLKKLQAQFAESQAHLGEYLGLYQIHSATQSSGVLEKPEVLDELQRIKASGIAIGLTLSGPEQSQTLLRALEVNRQRQGLFDAVQLTWNLLEQSVGQALWQAKEAGFFIIIKEALANGRLTSRGLRAGAAIRPGQRALQDLARQYNQNPDALALAYILRQSWADSVLSGAASSEQLKDNLRAHSVSFSEQDLKILQAAAQDSVDYWADRSRLAWN